MYMETRMKQIIALSLFIFLILISCSSGMKVKDEKVPGKPKRQGVVQTGADHSCGIMCYNCHRLKASEILVSSEPFRIDKANIHKAASQLKDHPNIICLALTGDTKKVKEYIDMGADVDYKDFKGINALMNAAYINDFKMAELLIENGADVNARKERGVTPLMCAALEDSVETAKLLIDNGADVNAKDKYKKTALSYAKEKGHTEIVELLKAADAKELF